jgi:hypothetical protein
MTTPTAPSNPSPPGQTRDANHSEQKDQPDRSWPRFDAAITILGAALSVLAATQSWDLLPAILIGGATVAAATDWLVRFPRRGRLATVVAIIFALAGGIFGSVPIVRNITLSKVSSTTVSSAGVSIAKLPNDTVPQCGAQILGVAPRGAGDVWVAHRDPDNKFDKMYYFDKAEWSDFTGNAWQLNTAIGEKDNAGDHIQFWAFLVKPQDTSWLDQMRVIGGPSEQTTLKSGMLPDGADPNTPATALTRGPGTDICGVAAGS